MIIFLYGADTYRSKQKLRELKNKFVHQKDKGGFNIFDLDGATLTTDKFRQTALSAGLFSIKRLIVIEKFLTQNKDKNLHQEILQFLKKVRHDKDNIIIFWEANLEKITNKKIGDLLKKEEFSQEFSLLRESQIIEWARKEITKRGGKIDISTARYLVHEVGKDLWRLSNEINKLVAYTSGQPIAREHIETLVNFKVEESIWLLVDAIGEKNRARALKLLADQINIDTPIDMLFGMLIRQYRIILQVKEALHSKGRINPYQLANCLHLPVFVCQKAIRQAANYSFDELKKIYRKLLSIDIKIKTSRVDPEILLDLLIIG